MTSENTPRQYDTHKVYRLNYKEKIRLISTYFNIPRSGAIYLYHRRKRSFPFKKKGSPNFLDWNLSIQNGLVKIMGDNPDIDWVSSDFNDENKLFTKFNIDINAKVYSVYKNKPTKVFDTIDVDEKMHDEGWTMVVSKNKNASNKFALRKLGLLPQSRENIKLTKKNRKHRVNKLDENQSEIPPDIKKTEKIE